MKMDDSYYLTKTYLPRKLREEDWLGWWLPFALPHDPVNPIRAAMD